MADTTHKHISITEVTVSSGKKKSFKLEVNGRNVTIPVDDAVYAHYMDQLWRESPTKAEEPIRNSDESHAGRVPQGLRGWKAQDLSDCTASSSLAVMLFLLPLRQDAIRPDQGQAKHGARAGEERLRPKVIRCFGELGVVCFGHFNAH
jgi:hypothetical protein